jgi:hypothetical protein
MGYSWYAAASLGPLTGLLIKILKAKKNLTDCGHFHMQKRTSS